MSISSDFSPVLVFTKKYFMKTFGAAALGAPCLLSKSSLMSYSSQTASRGWAIWKRSRAATCTWDYCTEVAAHAPEDRLKSKSLGFSMKRRESCGGPK